MYGVKRVSATTLRAMSISLMMIGLMTAARPASACSKATLKGTYGFSFGWPQYGYNLRQGMFVGQFTADGSGNITSGSGTGSGVLSSGSFTGTYSILSNCTGTLVFNQTTHFNIFLDEAGEGFQMIRADNNWETPGFGVSQSNSSCGLTGTKGTLSINVVGSIPGSGINYAMVGLLSLNGAGKITGTEVTTSVNFTNTTYTKVTGTYTEKSDCTGTLQIVPKGASARNFNSVSVNGGKELLLIETDSGTVVAGTALQ